ncbi:hypothetical protein FF38_10887 [Lucilia cuprina]|uniref:Uncharacterized protein n=1 Tax=Lucilia cuprina TaxID=7375 RepID=A0A0L0CM10_LUCCU|nr:hypothetical protein FF38_10887 [Lucilia cuprina]
MGELVFSNSTTTIMVEFKKQTNTYTHTHPHTKCLECVRERGEGRCNYHPEDRKLFFLASVTAAGWLTEWMDGCLTEWCYFFRPSSRITRSRSSSCINLHVDWQHIDTNEFRPYNVRGYFMTINANNSNNKNNKYKDITAKHEKTQNEKYRCQTKNAKGQNVNIGICGKSSNEILVNRNIIINNNDDGVHRISMDSYSFPGATSYFIFSITIEWYSEYTTPTTN